MAKTSWIGSTTGAGRPSVSAHSQRNTSAPVRAMPTAERSKDRGLAASIRGKRHRALIAVTCPANSLNNRAAGSGEVGSCAVNTSVASTSHSKAATCNVPTPRRLRRLVHDRALSANRRVAMDSASYRFVTYSFTRLALLRFIASEDIFWAIV